MTTPSKAGEAAAEYQEILYSVADRIATVTLNQPARRNALTFRLRRELIDALRRAESDDDVTVVLIRANGPSFSGGYALSTGRRPDPESGEAEGKAYWDDGTRPERWIDAEEFDGWTDQWARSCLRDWMNVWELLKPVVAMVHGHCLAGGTELMSLCDIAFVADDAQIGYPPVRGMTSPDIPYFPWKMTMAQAKYLQLTGNSVTGAEAAAMGWVAKSFPPEELEEQTMRELRAMSHIAPSLLAANKESLNQAYEIMGMRTHFHQAWAMHSLSGALRPGARDFSQRLREGGLKAALEWRDGPARGEGFL
ncbi:enoyl-CoA hydratase [Streptomyces sp. SAI-133]|jgi:enoyl-CoA hydratase|uniref:enoyl-CoA hydratase-related protein n=1 Tax=unclassified Streptomyces TaxID=2593676 RepID=UPI00247608B6|nr:MULTISPECIES: enoyl-CoA hydratase-related protein [unclassified Streptomyces]MDH6554464.1 enoyl-CoA hydratase [Streptomyces sp. SAI-041]MDH6581538.1 enoyl-CoA hydratase [Streptomyces sp. SAI-133]